MSVKRDKVTIQYLRNQALDQTQSFIYLFSVERDNNLIFGMAYIPLQRTLGTNSNISKGNMITYIVHSFQNTLRT